MLSVKDFGSIDKLYFTIHYYEERKTEFHKENLELKGNLTELLRSDYKNADEMQKMFSIYPNTKREVGDLPEDWAKLLTDKNKGDIIQAIDNFIKSRDVETFEKELSKTFNRKVRVTIIDSGEFGTGYKISMDNSQDKCLKVFHNKEYSADDKNVHGKYIEVQNALFANAHSNNFVRMYMGRIGIQGKEDSFMLTQYLDKNTELDTKNTINSTQYNVETTDGYAGNYVRIKGKKIYIDFGAIKIYKKHR